MMFLSWEFFTYLGAFLIGGSAVSLLFGLYAIKSGKRELHRKLMLTASVLALLFLVNYGVKGYLFPPRTYTGSWRELYIAILWFHTALAGLNIPLVLGTLYLSLVRRNFTAHKKVARVTAVVWLTVAATGWIILFFII